MAKKKKAETALQNYVNDSFGKIRAMLIDGLPYFVGKDVAKALGYRNTKAALSKHVDEEDKTRGAQIAPPSGKQEMTVINESGLYSLILSSKLPTAKKFKRWVTDDVLPSIRKTGSYTLDKDLKELIEARLDGKQMRKAEQVPLNFLSIMRGRRVALKTTNIFTAKFLFCAIWASDFRAKTDAILQLKNSLLLSVRLKVSQLSMS